MSTLALPCLDIKKNVSYHQINHSNVSQYSTDMDNVELFVYIKHLDFVLNSS